MFSYEPLTNEQCEQARYSLLKDGNYEAVVHKAEYKQSENGNHMFVLNLDVYDEKGNIYPIRDYLIFTPKMMWKIRHFCESAGLIKEFEEGKFTSVDLVEKANVLVLVTSQKGQEIPDNKLNGKPKGSLYPDRNIISDYKVFEKKKESKSSSDFVDDDIPF